MPLGRPEKKLVAAVGERVVAFALRQPARDPSSPAAPRTTQVELPEGFAWEKPGDLAARVRSALAQAKISERRVTLGLPMRWLLLKPMQLPPTDPASATAILRLAIEREFQADAREWVFDYAGGSSAGARSSVLLLATARARLEQVVAVMTEAGLAVECVTSTGLELVAAEDTPLLHLSADGAELGVPRPPAAPMIERLDADVNDAAALTGQVRLALAMAGAPEGAAQKLRVLPTVETAPGVLASLALGLGLGRDQVLADGNPTPAWAARLIAEGLTRRGPQVNFLRSRLAPPPTRWLNRTRLAFVAASAAIVLFFSFLAGDWYLESMAVDDLRQQLAAMRDDVSSARANVDRLTLTRGWYAKRPPVLDCVRAVTLTFPSTSQAWATSLTVRDDLTGAVAGKALTERQAIDLLDRMQRSPRFTDVKLLYLRQTERSSKVTAFGISFTYTGKE